MSLLQVGNLTVNYGPISAVGGVSFNVDAGQMVGIIGRNGAGKSSILQAICGLVPASGGSVVFDGKRVDRMPAHEVVKLGIAYVPEGRRVFADLSVHDNLTLGAFTKMSGRERGATNEGFDRVYGMFPILRDRAQQAAGTLSGGQQQMLAIGRALMSQPRLLLLDEPSMGLAPVVVNDLFATVSRLHKEGLTVLIVEQKAFKTLKMVDFAHVVGQGKITLAGTGAQLLANEEIKVSYLGTDRAANAAAAQITATPAQVSPSETETTDLPKPIGAMLAPPPPEAAVIAPAAASSPAPAADVVVDRTRTHSFDSGGVGTPQPVESIAAVPVTPERGLAPGESLRPRFLRSREQALRDVHQRTRA